MTCTRCGQPLCTRNQSGLCNQCHGQRRMRHFRALGGVASVWLRRAKRLLKRMG